jgi:PAS domain S-box-containing protein
MRQEEEALHVGGDEIYGLVKATGVIAGVFLTMVAVWKVILPFLRECWEALWHMFNNRRAHEEIKAMLFESSAEISARLERIESEFKINGGKTTLKDLVTEGLAEVRKEVTFVKAFMRTSLKKSRVAAFETNAYGECTAVNRAHSRLTGFRPDECLGRNWVNVIAPETREWTMQAWSEAVRQVSTFDENLVYVKPESGERYTVHVTADPIICEEGLLQGYLGEVTLVEES